MTFQERERLTVKELTEQAARIGLNARENEKAASRSAGAGTAALFVAGVEITGGAASRESVVAAIQKGSARTRR